MSMPPSLPRASVSLRPDWPKPQVSDSSAILVRPRFFMSTNTRSAAMRSLCGDLEHPFLHRLDDHHAAGERNERNLRPFDQRIIAHRRAGGGAADQTST